MIDVVVGHADDLVRGLVRSALEDDGCHVREAASSSAVLSACREQPPDVVVVDVTLCQKEHTPLLNRLKQDPVLFPVAVVLLADANAPRDVLRTLDQGAQDVILLPLRGADVIARVRAAARTKALQEEFLKRGRTMEDLVYGDPLTGLHNRRFILTQLNSLVASARRHERDLSVIVIDVDGFKRLNDRRGESAGDEILRNLAELLEEVAPQGARAYRVGGDEFALVMEAADRGTPQEVAWQLQAQARERLGTTLSIGVALAAEGESDEDLITRADAAVTEVKRRGRDGVALARRP